MTAEDAEPPVGFLVTDPGGTVVQANDLVLAWLGRSRDDVVGVARFADLLSVGGRIHYETHLAPTLLMLGSAGAVAVDLLAADGRRVPAFVTATLDRNGTGEPSRIRIAVFDAAERRSYEVELLAERKRAEASEHHAREVARTLQQVLLPPTLPTIRGLDVGAAFRPAGSGAELGGDFYDLFELDDGSWYVVVGDVCGKGVEAAVVTALARNTVRAEVVRAPSLTEVLTVLNRTLLVHEADRHCTVGLVRLVQREVGWRATICTGGHPLPLWRGPDGSVSPVGMPGSLLGIFPDVDLREEDVDLGPGSALVLYTDGVVEARVAGRFFGDERLAALVAAGAPSAQAHADLVAHDVVAFQDGVTSDDVAVVVVRVP